MGRLKEAPVDPCPVGHNLQPLGRTMQEIKTILLFLLPSSSSICLLFSQKPLEESDNSNEATMEAIVLRDKGKLLAAVSSSYKPAY